MKKPLPILAAAILMLASCTKEEDTTRWINGTHWRYNYTESTGRNITCALTLKNDGTLTITDRYNGPATSWSDRWEYRVTSYTYDGDRSGTITLQGINYYATPNATARFTLNYDQKQMDLSTPNGTYTLTRTQ